jgi:molybdenum cofactor synthesis domain-containing protein
MKLIKTEAAVGQILCHDITQIIKGVSKGPVFKKGHVIREEDIPVLLRVGKENIYIWENNENMLHENDAAKILFDLCKDDNMHSSDISEGKIELIADIDGVLKVDREKLRTVNGLGEMMIASRHGNFPVKKGDKLAGTRIIPLVIEREKMQRVADIKAPIFTIAPYKLKTAGVVTTGSEVKKKLIEDTFTPVIKDKLKEYGGEVVSHSLCGDDNKLITDTILSMIDSGVDMVICTGGMSVDPDDRTPLAIKNTGADIVTYGAPVLPGAMFMLAYKGAVPVIGLPGCVMYSKRTIFDLALPRILTGERLNAEDFVAMGEGGLCLSCDVCTFPNCGFGKGR